MTTTTETVDSTLVFDVDQYLEHEPFERAAEGVHERGERQVRLLYDLDTETDETVLRVIREYYLGGDLEKETGSDTETYRVEGGIVQNGPGYELERFIEDHFETDPGVVLTEEFETIVGPQ